VSTHRGGAQSATGVIAAGAGIGSAAGGVSDFTSNEGGKLVGGGVAGGGCAATMPIAVNSIGPAPNVPHRMADSPDQRRWTS